MKLVLFIVYRYDNWSWNLHLLDVCSAVHHSFHLYRCDNGNLSIFWLFVNISTNLVSRAYM